MTLRNSPDSLAPERIIVFEVKDSVQNFFTAVKKIPGLEYINEIEQEADGVESGFCSYLLIPDATALNQILSLWERYKDNEELRGHSPWKEVFATLLDVRVWGSKDRLNVYNRGLFEGIINTGDESVPIYCEIELIFRNNTETANREEASLKEKLKDFHAEVRRSVIIPEIRYHAILAAIPPKEIRSMLNDDPDSLSHIEPIFHIRPQSIVNHVETADGNLCDFDETYANGAPILALFDGVAAQAHPWLKNHIEVRDIFEFENAAQVEDRAHATAMASAIIHGDRHNRNQISLKRKIILIPILSAFAQFPKDHLMIDLIFQSVKEIASSSDSKGGILIVNLSIGDGNNIFQGRISPLARLIDWLAFEFGILFIVSAGNHTDGIEINLRREIYDLDLTTENSKAVIESITQIIAHRRLYSPAEAINVLTVGAWNFNEVPRSEWASKSDTEFNPYNNLKMSNPSSALGPGFANSVKPDILMPGSREHFTPAPPASNIFNLAKTNANSGIKVASVNFSEQYWLDTHTSGTSVAASLTSRTAHLIHDALEEAYGDAFLTLKNHQKSLLIKALLVHTAWWPEKTYKIITEVFEATQAKLGIEKPHHTKKKEHTRRFLGYGISHPEIAQTCADDRVTFWAVGEVGNEQKIRVEMPLPICLKDNHGDVQLHATLAWFTPIKPERAVYRAVRLSLTPSKNDNDEVIALKTKSDQPDHHAIKRGTVSSQFWDVSKHLNIKEGQFLEFYVQREIDAGEKIDEPIPFGLAITINAQATSKLYAQAKAMVDEINSKIVPISSDIQISQQTP